MVLEQIEKSGVHIKGIFFVKGFFFITEKILLTPRVRLTRAYCTTSPKSFFIVGAIGGEDVPYCACLLPDLKLVVIL